MKIQCNVCEAAEAKVLCCADEAALCSECDEKVHAANKLSSKHQRVPLSTSSSQMPKCDICQETVGYFFCLEDRALLCRRCDVAIHTANRLVSTHQRFLLTGVKVGLETAKLEKASGSNPPPAPKSTTTLLPTTDQSNKTLPSVAGDISLSNLDEFLELGNADFTQNYDFMDPGSSKADFGRLRDADCLPLLRVGNMEVEGEGCMGQSPDTLWTVPQIPSPPTASGLYWPKISHCAALVPDIISLPAHNHGDNLKRRRHF